MIVIKNLFLALFFSTFLFVGSVSAESIKEFFVDIKVNEDSSIDVQEKILYDFGPENRHGIIRDIPIVYGSDIDQVELNLELKSITDSDGEPYEYEDSSSGYFRTLKIGDADVGLSGEHWYYLAYHVDEVINPFADYDELYWNVTGNESNVHIEKVVVTVTVPEGGSYENKQAACYTGYSGSSYGYCSYRMLKENEFYFETSSSLLAHEGFTVVTGFDKGLVVAPTILKISSTPEAADVYLNKQYLGYAPYTFRVRPGDYDLSVSLFKYKTYKEALSLQAGETRKIELILEKSFVFYFMEKYLPLLISLIAIIFVFYFWWRDRGPKRNNVIMPIYKSPEALSPGAVGIIYRGKKDIRDVSAGLIELAVKGYIKIISSKRKLFLGLFGRKFEYSFKRLKDPQNDQIPEYEKSIFAAIFGKKNKKKADAEQIVSLDDIKFAFAKKLKGINKDLCAEVNNKSLFREKFGPEENLFALAFQAFIVAIVVFLIIAAFAESIYYLLPPLVVIPWYILELLKEKRSEKGVKIYEEALGFREFLSMTEQDRLKKLFSPKEYRGVFEKYLPYAMVLGVEKEWAEQFGNLDEKVPSWYEAENMNGLSDFIVSVTAMTSVSEKVLAASLPTETAYGSSWSGGSSSWGGGSGFSGGSSGGGFGGGGTSSW